jgi:hypothetical protein
MNILRLFIFAAAFLTSSFLTSLVPVQEKFVELSPVEDKVSPLLIETAAENFFNELNAQDPDGYFETSYYEFLENENIPVGLEKSSAFTYAVSDLNEDGRAELFVSNSKLSISGNYSTVVYSIGENNTLTKLLETDGVFSVSVSAGAGGYKIIRTNRHESAAERSIAEFSFNAELGEYQQSKTGKY